MTELRLVKDEANENPYHGEHPLFSVECDEPEGKVVRNVYQAKFTPQFFRDMWDKQKRYKTLMGVEISSFAEFVDFFVDVEKKDGEVKYNPKGVCLVIDNLVGIFWISDIHHPVFCEAHYTFFDGRHKGRLELVKSGMKFIFNAWGINLIYVMVALYAKLPIRFVESLGFKKEGRLRARVQYRGKYWDVNCYSMLREEHG